MNDNERKIYMKQYRIDNKENIKQYQKQYMKQYYIKNKEKIDAIIKKYSKNNPQKRKCHIFINNLLKNSDFTRDMCCICGKPNAHFHHENYDLPNFGYWICRKYHNEIHRGVI